METIQLRKTYKSPPRKLAWFFEQSRNRWKQKYGQSKRTVKRLQNQVRFLETSKAKWRQRVQDLETELAQWKTAVPARNTVVSLGNASALALTTPAPTSAIPFTQVPFHHHYSIGFVLWFVSLVLRAATSLRGAGQSIQVTLATFQWAWAAPSWFTGRWWLLRIGYFKLTRVKTHAPDWVWIVDLTLQLGAEKCLVILGVRLSALPSRDRCLGLTEVEPLVVCPLTQVNAAKINQQLTETVKKTGIPREIISDAGSDVHAGIVQFCTAHPTTCWVYDIKHKTALVLKHELEPDATWQTFIQRAAQTKHQVQQTGLAAFAPPNQKTQARYMNVDRLVHWGQKVQYALEHPAPGSSYDAVALQAKLGWVTQFAAPLQEWSRLLDLVTTVETVIRHQGLSRGVTQELRTKLPAQESDTARAQRVRQDLLTFVAAEELKAAPEERLLGSSEVIESAFGKLKRLERDQAKNGFTGLVLGLAALTAPTTAEVIEQALATVSTKDVLAWCKHNLGSSLQALKRKLTLTLPSGTKVGSTSPAQ
jgi:hypothetical protein